MKYPEELYDKEIRCPVCNEEFSTKIVRQSKLRLIHRDEDFLTYYNLENPIKYNAIVCPNCGYSAHQNIFENIDKSRIPVIIDNISSRWTKRSFGDVRDLNESIEAYKLTLINYNLIKKSSLDLGNILLNIAWLYRLKEDNDEEVRFMALAREKFIEAYNLENLAGTNMDESKLSYLIGELSRRLNERDQALSWFNICINLPSTKMNPTINNMVREQWRVTKNIEQ